MIGPVSMNRNDVIGIPDNPRYGYSAVNNNYVTNNFLKLNGSVAMTGNLNMANHKITDVGAPTADKDVSNKQYVDGKTKSGPSHTLTNTFKYVMDDINEISTEYGLIADKINDLIWSFHSNQHVLYFKAINDGSNNYRYRLGLQMYHASSVANTIAIEQFFTSQAKWNKAQITINGSAIAIESYHIPPNSVTTWGMLCIITPKQSFSLKN